MHYITLRDVLAIHQEVLAVDGGTPGIRDKGALESALFRPQTGYYEDLVQQAAALLESLVMNHCFTDGNKRTAFVSVDAFLRLNGFYVECDGQTAYEHWTVLFETHTFNFAHLESWLRENVKPL